MAIGSTTAPSIAGTITTEQMLRDVMHVVEPKLPLERLMETVDAKGYTQISWNYGDPIDRAVHGGETTEPAGQQLTYNVLHLTPNYIEQAVNVTELAKLTTFVNLENEVKLNLAQSYILRYNMDVFEALREAGWCYVPQGAAGTVAVAAYLETPLASAGTRVAHAGDLEHLNTRLRDDLWMNPATYDAKLSAAHDKLLYITTATGAHPFKYEATGTVTRFETWNVQTNPELYFGWEAGTIAGFIIGEIHDTHAISTNVLASGVAEGFILGYDLLGRKPIMRGLWRGEEVFVDYITRAKKAEIWTIDSIQNFRLRTGAETQKGLVLCVQVTSA